MRYMFEGTALEGSPEGRANMLAIRCAWAGGSAFDVEHSNWAGWTDLGICSLPPSPPSPPSPPPPSPSPPPSFLFDTTDSLRTAVQMWVNDTQAASITYGHISNWGVSSITNMNGLFRDLPTFNEDISSWATGSVTDMGYMFAVDYMFASAFNQPLSFDTSSVTSMSHMFMSADAFNQPLSFDTSSVTSMSYMFAYMDAFNQPLSFDTSSVTDISEMFTGNDAFNQPLSFDTSSVTSMSYMFKKQVRST